MRIKMERCYWVANPLLFKEEDLKHSENYPFYANLILYGVKTVKLLFERLERSPNHCMHNNSLSACPDPL